MSSPVYDGGSMQLRTDTGTVGGGKPIDLIGFYVNSTTGGTLVLSDGAAAVSGTITPAIGFHRFPGSFGTSCTATIANTLSVTFFFSKSTNIAS